MTLVALACWSLDSPAAQHPATANDDSAELLPQLYAHCLSEGRSDVEIRFSAQGSTASARVTPLADGGFSSPAALVPAARNARRPH